MDENRDTMTVDEVAKRLGIAAFSRGKPNELI